ncbi:TolC family protein [Marinobacter sp. S6332]|uniref:TolC family protein n=1 Tax=Marinobacter sp. S6332 TaxID=2926403 RepID=UPI001FF400C5|nr:TolC family protein [Marinobacter sp. S6332]MCK0163724.1 TolC family protein [Marinobacter sp. S6332]
MKLLTILACGCVLFSNATTALAQEQAGVTLADVYQSALEKNFGLQSQKYSYQAQKEGVREAWAGVLPQVEATASYGTSEYTRDFDLQSSITDRDQHTRYDVRLNQVVYSERAFEAISRAKVAEELAQEELDALSIDIGYAAIEAFLRAQSINAEKAIVQDELVSYERRLEQIQSMRERGFASKADALDAKAMLDETQAELTGLIHTHRAALKNLEAVTGLNMLDKQLVPLPSSLWERTPLILEADWQDVARSMAGKIQRAKGELKLASAAREMEKGAHWPELYLNASYTNNDTFATNLREETRVELQLRLPLYKGGGTSSRVRQARQKEYAAEYSLRDTENNVRVEIARITESLLGSYSRIRALTTAEKSALAAVDASEQGFRGGVRSLSDVFDSRTRLSGIRRNLVNEVHQNHMLQFELHQMAGTLTMEQVRGANRASIN